MRPGDKVKAIRWIKRWIKSRWIGQVTKRKWTNLKCMKDYL